MTATTDVGSVPPPASDPSGAPAGGPTAAPEGITGTGTLDADSFRSVFRRHAAGVAVVTATGPAGPVGFTATSLTSVAVEPPLFSFGVNAGSASWSVLAGTAYVAVHILGEHQEDLAALFARRGADRFGPATDWSYGPHGVPLLGGVPAWLVGRIEGRVPAGDHRIVVARAVAGDFRGPGGPLLYHHGGFRRLSR